MKFKGGALVTAVMILLYYLYRRWYPVKHGYWDQQPVQREFPVSSSGQLVTNLIHADNSQLPKPQSNPNFSIYHFDINSPREGPELLAFWNQHFIKGYRYTLPFLRWSLPTDNRGNLCLRKGRQLIGTISTRDYRLSIAGQEYQIGYVDYLAVHQDYRNQRLAPLLISETVSRYPDKTRNSFIFRIESRPLPFQYLVKFRYYACPIVGNTTLGGLVKPSGSLVELTEEYLISAWEFYQRESVTYKLHVMCTQSDFRRWFLPRDGVVHTYIRITHGQVTTLISGFYCEIINDSWLASGNAISVMEITVALSKPTVLQAIGTLIPDMAQFLQISERLQAGYVVAANTGLNRSFIDTLGFSGGKSCYLQLYNISFTQLLNPSQVLFF